MGSLPQHSGPSLVIPTIDIDTFHEHPETDAQRRDSQRVVEQVRDACIRFGFFSITGHGIERSLQDRLFTAAENLFDLPLDEKRKMTHKTIKNRGYEVMGGQTLQKGTRPDLKESFYISKHYDDNENTIKDEYRRLMGPNVFPEESVLPAAEFQQPVEEYYSKALSLAKRIFKILARGLGYGDDVFDTFAEGDDPICILRLLHYPTQADPSDKLQLGAGAHTDWGAITLLLTRSAGLEVRNPLQRKSQGEEEEEWIAVPPTPDAYVVNIGDMLHSWTGGAYLSNTHRVRNLGGSHRYSAAFFFDGNADCPLEPFDKSHIVPGRRYETAGQHLLRRIDETYAAASSKK